MIIFIQDMHMTVDSILKIKKKHLERFFGEDVYCLNCLEDEIQFEKDNRIIDNQERFSKTSELSDDSDQNFVNLNPVSLQSLEKESTDPNLTGQEINSQPASIQSPLNDSTNLSGQEDNSQQIVCVEKDNANNESITESNHNEAEYVSNGKRKPIEFQ